MRGGRLLCLLVLLAAGCAPTVLPSGPPTAMPRLADDAVIAADGARLPLRRWAPLANPHPEPKAVILAVHGFNDHAGFFEDPGVYFATRGIISYAYDQRGFGAAPNPGFWPGTAALTGDLKTVTKLLRARHPGLPLYLVGTSMGGGIILAALAESDPPRADGAVLVGPAVWGRETMPWYQSGALWIAAHTAPGLRLTGRQLGIQASDNIAMLRALGRDPLFIKETRIDAAWGITNLMDAALAAAPRVKGQLLVLYGARDEIIPEEPTRMLVESLRANPDVEARIALYDEGWHMLLRDLQAVTVWKDIAAWIARPQALLPSGADKRAARVWTPAPERADK